MGANKDLFMDEREREQLSFAESLEFQERNEKVSEVKMGLNAMPGLIDLEIKEFQDGNISSLDLALKFRGYSEVFKSLSEKMDEWIKENKMSISHEADKYPEGYHGYKVVLQSRETSSFKNIPQWVALEDAKKRF